MYVSNVSVNHGKINMDHQQLMDQINKRLDETDTKIDRNDESINKLRDDLHADKIKMAVVETQMAGVVKFLFLIISSLVGIVGYAIKKGIF